MAGINFMALADGMMQADKLNKEDDTYWRKQAKEDRDMQYQERDQAYKEQTQGYDLDAFKEKAETTEASRFISQASDILSKAAAAQGKQKWQVMLESPEFTVPDGAPGLQSKVQSGIRAGLVATEALNLRQRGDWKNAELLEQKYGMSQRSDVGAMQAYSDTETGNKRVMDLFPGSTVNEKGNYIIGGQEVPRGVAIGLTFNPAASGSTMINQYKVNEQTAAQALAAQQGGANQALIQQSNARMLDEKTHEAVRQAVVGGYTEAQVAPHLRELFRTMKGAPATGSGSPPIGASVAAATAAPAAAPAAIKSVASMAAAPISLEDWRNTLQGSQSTDPMGVVTGVAPPDAAPQSFESAVNHFSSQQLEGMRSNITSGKGLPGMSARATAAALQTINDEIASRYKAQAVRYQRGMQQ